MKKFETFQLFDMLKAAYPGIYGKKARDEKEIESFATLYFQTFGHEEYETVKQALSALIIGSKFPPTISEVTEQIERIKDLAEFHESPELDDDLLLSAEDMDAFENALIAFEKVCQENDTCD